ncbi:hypothetical protein EXN66_Car007084 [Channa argus]|uniref:Uncharacterized protein n=1 Tax=Channa argus TaxID=215402 RepID=A0A6G1PMF9_CHAAH|nr:hypothetical protein EXN66_Car007084 [Channa argus]
MYQTLDYWIIYFDFWTLYIGYWNCDKLYTFTTTNLCFPATKILTCTLSSSIGITQHSPASATHFQYTTILFFLTYLVFHHLPGPYACLAPDPFTCSFN